MGSVVGAFVIEQNKIIVLGLVVTVFQGQQIAVSALVILYQILVVVVTLFQQQGFSIGVGVGIVVHQRILVQLPVGKCPVQVNLLRKKRLRCFKTEVDKNVVGFELGLVVFLYFDVVAPVKILTVLVGARVSGIVGGQT